ncbi:hypothetical protein C8T65DRAFT_739282 [Cerioporus squamosus]|nr:hypothetical protein C8T65DRAFT_739282 [Cerioporus squamosus]
MDNSLLPIQVCENIIDSCDWSFVDYATLRYCGLTCTAWLPRSRLNLYHSVKLIGPYKLDLFLRTLKAHPYLFNFVRELEIGSSAERPYVPFAQPSTRDLVQLVWAFKDLRSLVVDCTVRNNVLDPELGIMHMGRSRRLSLCNNLTDLSLRFSGSGPIANFPSPGTFGHFVAHLKLHFDRAPSPDDESDFACLMSRISDFAALETLEITDVLGGHANAHIGLTCKAGFLTRLLDSVSADAPLHRLHLRLLAYGELRPALLLDEMLTDDVRDAFQRHPALARFDLTVECASSEQPGQDLYSALQVWFANARVPVQVQHSTVVVGDGVDARYSCTWTPSLSAYVAPHRHLD